VNATENICPFCGKAVQTTALRGICPECMLKAGLVETGEVGPDGTVMAKPPAMPAPAVAEIAPHFPQLEILECLGRGGMGAVYKARQPKLDRFVALKILTRRQDSGISDTEFAARFQQEARALARLNHPDIVAVYDFGEVGAASATGTVAGTLAGGTPAPVQPTGKMPMPLHYLLMEYVDGLTLRQLLQTKKISPEEALAIVPKICEALQFAHERGIVHRDIKPENILLDKQGRVKIADFGIAKILGSKAAGGSLTGVKDVIGTPHYMAPEQVEKPAKVDHRADIYSVGVVFYEMLTGELPLGKFAPPSSKVHVDVRLDEVVLHALEKEPERRYQHVSEVKSDVETIAATPSAAKSTEPPVQRDSSAPAVKRQLKGPAMGLLSAAALQLVVFLGLVGLAIPAVGREGGDAGGYAAMAFMSALSLMAALVVLVGVLQMMSLRNRSLAVIASVVATFAGPAAIIGLPCGVWALMVLNRREVRAAFRSKETATLGSASWSGPSPWWRAARAGLAVFAVVFGLPALITMLLPRTYEARARIQVQDPKLDTAKSDSELDWLLRDVTLSFPSPSLLERVATDLDLRKRWIERFRTLGLKEEETRAMLARQLTIERIPRTATFEIRCFSSRPAEAAEIANKAAELFCASPAGAKASFIDPATPPRQHVRPNEPLNLAFAAAVGLVLGIAVGAGVLLVGAIHPPRSNQAAKPPIDSATNQPATLKEAEVASSSRDSGWVLAARWTARIFSILLLAFYGFFVLAEGLPPIASQPEGVQLNFAALALMLLGFVIGWKREGAAALLIAAGWTLWHISEGRMRWNFFQTPLPVAALYGFCWWATHGRRTRTVVAAVATLAVCLGLGRLFVPTSVFIRGAIIDAQSGKAIPNAELRILPRSAQALEKGDPPNARADADGQFTLYVGRYEDGKELAISATGYAMVTTNLGPRELGQREVHRDFSMPPAVAFTQEHAVDTGEVAVPSVPPVVVATFPQSGASEVDPALKEIRVTFSEPMQQGGWSWTKWSEDSFPQLAGQAKYLDDERTCVLPVRLQPGRVYAIWINSGQHQNFKDQNGQSAVPYLLIFQTRK